jgi:hypothetical protein
MKTNKSFKSAALFILGFSLCSAGNSGAASISFDTLTPSYWSVTAGGVTATPYEVSDYIVLTSTAYRTGTFLQGGNIANFDGFWVADFTFSLPANAQNVTLNYGNFYTDDRAVLTLNGNAFAATGLGSPGAGSMMLTDGGPLQAYTFGGPDGSVSGTVTSGFNVGGVNTIRAIINNTDNGISGSCRTFGSDIDSTQLGLSGMITYSVVPEPSSAILAVVGLALFALRQRGSE